MGLVYQNKSLPEPYVIYVQNFDFTKYLEYANEDIDCELLNGVLVIHSPASLKHELIFKFLLNLLDLYCREKRLGLVIGSRFTMKLSDLWGPEPDIMFISQDQIHRLKDTYLDGPATVVFEILSPSTRNDDLNEKLPKFLESGIKEIWIIDPEDQTITLHTKDAVWKDTMADWVISNVIPGFKIMKNWIWNAENQSVLDAFHQIK